MTQEEIEALDQDAVFAHKDRITAMEPSEERAAEIVILIRELERRERESLDIAVQYRARAHSAKREVVTRRIAIEPLRKRIRRGR